VKRIEELKTKIFADGADLAGMLEMYRNPLIKGFTTNPTLMRKAGIDDYFGFAKKVLQEIPDRPVSFEVFADQFDEMEWQALEIASWGPNVAVKIPVTNTHRMSARDIVRRLAHAGVRLNVTALLTLQQVREVSNWLGEARAGYISVFAGRIADTGRDPTPLMAEAVQIMSQYPQLELVWASPRELLNIFHADSVGCHVITVTNDILKKLGLIDKDLEEYSLETVKMFYEDGKKAGYSLQKPIARCASYR
jgi:transaldolase